MEPLAMQHPTTTTTTTTVPLANLIHRLDNANTMPPDAFEKLAAHINRTGNYPPIIVRPSPSHADQYEILDGHHRAKALAQLGISSAHCVIWDNVDDDEAVLLLTTLNRLHGTDDITKRAHLVKHLTERFGRKQVESMLPDSTTALDQLLQIHQPAPPPAPAPQLATMPEAVTIFLTVKQKQRLDEQLSQFKGSRSHRIVQLLNLNTPTPS